jgi:hypothetical protein
LHVGKKYHLFDTGFGRCGHLSEPLISYFTYILFLIIPFTNSILPYYHPPNQDEVV